MSPAPRPIYTEPDKRTSLEGLASHLQDGAVVAVGGGLSSREPMALLRALLRRGAAGLTVVGSAHGIDIRSDGRIAFCQFVADTMRVTRVSKSRVACWPDRGTRITRTRTLAPERFVRLRASVRVVCWPLMICGLVARRISRPRLDSSFASSQMKVMPLL